MPVPTATVESIIEEADDTVYQDPDGRFSVPIPTNWTVESAEGYGALTDPDENITIYVLVVDGAVRSRHLRPNSQILEHTAAILAVEKHPAIAVEDV